MVDYRYYYAEAVKRLIAAGYQVEGKDYLGQPLEPGASVATQGGRDAPVRGSSA